MQFVVILCVAYCSTWALSTPVTKLVVCADSCATQFHCGCLRDKLQAGQSKKEALQECRNELKREVGDLANVGCAPNCKMPSSRSCADPDEGAGARSERNAAPLPVGLSSTPVLCTHENKGRCDCRYLDEGGKWIHAKTYTWKQGCEQRCATVYIPPTAHAPPGRQPVGASGKIPVSDPYTAIVIHVDLHVCSNPGRFYH
jgi:hypothetical protein